MIFEVEISKIFSKIIFYIVRKYKNSAISDTFDKNKFYNMNKWLKISILWYISII
jgi:hypothetical protein